MTINRELKLTEREANDIKMQNCVAWETAGLFLKGSYTENYRESKILIIIGK